MDSGDPLKEFLQNTGWSCDELLQKLLQIKSKSSTTQETKDETAKQNSLEDSVGNSSTVTTSKPQLTSTSTKSNVADRDFSDTDEEEKEVISTSKHIIEEIIDDISDDKTERQEEILPLETETKDCEPPKQDLSVIELDSEEEEDDNFEEECSHSSKKRVTLANSGLSKNKSSDEAEKSKVDPDSTIVIEDDEIADKEKSVVSSGDKKNDSSELNEVLASVSLIRTDPVDKTSTDDDLEVISIEDVYDNTDLQKQIGPIHVVSLGESALSAKEVDQTSGEKSWQLPTILTVEGQAGSCDMTEFVNNKNNPSSGSTNDKTSAQSKKKSCVNDIVQSISGTERTEIGKTDIQRRFSNIDSNQSTRESCLKKDTLPVTKGSTTSRVSSKTDKFPTCSRNKKKHSNHSTIHSAGETEKPSNVNTDFEDVIQAYVLDESAANNQSRTQEQSSLEKTAEQKMPAHLQCKKQKKPVQKTANSILSVSKNYTPSENRYQPNFRKSSNKKPTLLNPVRSEIASVEAEQSSTKNRPYVILMIEDVNKGVETSAESYPTKNIDVTDSFKEEWQLPKILSVEGAVDVDQIQTDAEEVDLPKKSNEALLSSSSHEVAPNSTTMTTERDAYVARKTVARPTELSGTSIVAQIPNGPMVEIPATVISELTSNQNQDLVTKGLIQPLDGPRIVQDTPQLSKTLTDPSNMDSRVEDSTNISECSTGKLTETGYPKPLLESSELSSGVNRSDINLTDETCQVRLKTVGDSTTCNVDKRAREFSILLVNCLGKDITKSDCPKKDVNQNQDPVQPKTSLNTSDTSSMNSKAGITSDSLHSITEFVSANKQHIQSEKLCKNSHMNITKELDQDGQKTKEVSSKLLERATGASIRSSKNNKAGETSDTLDSITACESLDKQDIQNQEPRTDSQINIMDKSDCDGTQMDEKFSKLMEGIFCSTTISKSDNFKENPDIFLNALDKAITSLSASKKVIQNQKSPADNVVQQKNSQESPMRAGDSQIDITEDYSQSETFKDSLRTADSVTECSIVGKVGTSKDQNDCSRECVFRAEDTEHFPKSLEKSSNFVHNVTIFDDDLENVSTENRSEPNLEKSDKVLNVSPMCSSSNNTVEISEISNEAPQKCAAEDIEIPRMISNGPFCQVSEASLHISSKTEGTITKDVDMVTNGAPDSSDVLEENITVMKAKPAIEPQIEPKTLEEPLELLKTPLDTTEHAEIPQKTDKSLSEKVSNQSISNKLSKVEDINIEDSCSKDITKDIGIILITDSMEERIRDQCGMPQKLMNSRQKVATTCDSEMKSHESSSHEPSIKLVSADVEPAMNDPFGNKDKFTSPENVWPSGMNADSAISPASTVEEVEYRLVDPHVVDSPNSAEAVIEEYLDTDVANTLSSSSTDDCVEYAVEALENTSPAEDTNQMAEVEGMPEEDESLRNYKGTSNPSSLSIAADAAERKEFLLIRRFDLGVKNVKEKSDSSVTVENSSSRNKRPEKSKDVKKYRLTASEHESQPRKSDKLSMVDIIQRKLTMRLLNESNANEEAVSANENRNKLLLHRNLPSADCLRHAEAVPEHIVQTNDSGDKQPVVPKESRALVDGDQDQMSKKISMADTIRQRLDAGFFDSSNAKKNAVSINASTVDIQQNSAAPTQQLPENIVMKDKITHRLLDSPGTVYPYKHQLHIDAKVSKSTALNENEDELVATERPLDLFKQAPKNAIPTNTDNTDVATNETDKSSQKGETGELSKESKPSTSTSGKHDVSEHTKKVCQEEVVFAVPKLPPLRASSSKNNETDIGNVETIRMNLKLQLNSLRNRKRQHVQITTKIDDSFFAEAASNQSEKKIMIKELSCMENIPQLQDELYTQTNELGLVILDVQGGVELDDQPVVEGTDTPAQEQSKQIHERSGQTGQEEGEKNEVEDLVRQIIGKKGEPKIRIRKDLAQPPPMIDDFEIFQKRFVEDDSTVCTSITADPGPSTSTAISHDEDMSVLESALFSGENSQLSSSNHEPSLPGSQLKSPFVSNTLDEFLTGDAQLNVSYNIPKCGAEEGLRELRFESEPPDLVLKKTVGLKQDTEGTMKKGGKKVRTLAQKRKLLEKQMAREKKQKEREQHKERIEKEKQHEKKKLEDKYKDRSYVIEGGKQIWVNSFLPRRCIVNIDDEAKSSQSKINLSQSPRQKKISLLENLQKKHQIKYAPGPLSKKHVLQVGGTTQWKTEVKSLPNVFVEVVPKLGRPLPPELIGRIVFDATLTSEHIEFALTALKTKKQPSEPDRKFVLPVQYKRNQRQIMVRKKVPPQVSQVDAPKAASQDNRDDDDRVIAKVVDDLISYVEIKELAPSLIKEDDYDFTDDFPVEKNTTPVIDQHLSVMKRSQKKRSKVDWELIRLNCKIVNVEVEKEEEEKPCQKPYCRLGCVCKSLRCESTMIFHCQNERCMFSCNCPKERQPAHEHRVTLPAGTNVLSTDTVTKIEDEAKKHLARVEREFTQTIIQTDNRTIVVGASGRSKTRRAAQLPKKYTDYVDHLEDDDVEHLKVDLSKKCLVSLTRLNLDAIIPYCLQHNQYDCFCRGLSDFRPYDHARVRTLAATGAASVTSVKAPPHHQPVKKTASAVDKGKQKKRANENAADSSHAEPPSKRRSFNDADVTTQQNADSGEQTTKELTDDEGNAPTLNWDGTGESDSPVTSRPVRNKKAKKSEYYDYEYPFDHVETCARFMDVTRYKRKAKFNIATAVKKDFVYRYTQADLLKIKMNYVNRRRHLEVDILKQTLLADYLATPAQNTPYARSIVPAELPLDKHLSNRKQTLQVRSEQDPPAKSSTNESIPSAAASTAAASTAGVNEKRRKSLKPKQPRPVFEGEIIINESSMDLLRKMGPRTVAEGYARLLPWRVLSDSFKSGAINIWCMIDQPSRLLVNKADKKAPKNYVDIRMTRQQTEVIMWILRDMLPSSYQEENVSFILRETKDNFEICGVCTKNLDTDRSKQKGHAPASSDTGSSPAPKTAEGEASNWLETGLELKHRDMSNRVQSLSVCIERHNLQTLAYENSADQPKINAHLPEIGSEYRWRLIHLKSDFSYLYFLKSNYSIKYMDLMFAAKMGDKPKDATLMLHSTNLKSGQDHPKMGIYFDQRQPNKMFVGPYSRSDLNENFAETMRYFNQKLVSTETFNKMSGKEDYRSGFWMVETAGGPDNLDDLAIVDLTADESPTALTTASAAGVTSGESPAKRRPSSAQRSRTTSRASMDGVMSSSSDSMLASVIANVSLTHENAHIEIVEAAPRKPEEFNRFVITNIPHFGYLGAFKHPTSDKIDVSWPFENKLLRFPAVKTATEFLQERFSALLLPVPETFRIHVIVVNHLDTSANLPIDANVLSGHYICGEFGYYNILTVTPQTCLTKLNRTREELLKMFAKRCQVIVKKRSETLACLLHLGKPTDREAVADVNDKAVEEINKLKMLELFLVNEKKEQMVKKRRLATELFVLLRELPEGQRNAYSAQFRNILMARQNTEPIEIASDSDQEAVEQGEEEEEERGPPVLEAQSSAVFVPPTPPFDELPVLEKQVPTGTPAVLPKREMSLIKPRPKKRSKRRVEDQPNAGVISESPKCTVSAAAAVGEQSMATITLTPPSLVEKPAANPRSLLRTRPESLLRTYHPKTPPTVTATPTATLTPTATPTATSTPTATPTATPTSPRGKYLKGIRVVKGPNGQFMIVPKRIVPSLPAPASVRLTPLPGSKVLVKKKKGGSSAGNESRLAMRSLNDSLTGDSATEIMDTDDMPVEEQND